MSKKNDDFFKQKKPWSEVKDELLGCYLKPYMQKILCTKHPVVYVDCFAGKGAFEDGKLGSPLIALNIIQQCINQTKINGGSIQSNFIDLNYADDLHKNLDGYENVTIIPGRYEDKIENLLLDKEECNVFLYIDPYGIRALNYSLFQDFATKYKFNSIELLINMNSFGFIREGCRVLGGKFESNDIFEDLIEYESTKLDSNKKSVRTLDEIAGGDYWQDIIKLKNRDKISIYEAESLFSEQYCARLRENYKYVLNMPLKIKRGQVPKYRMIHATNHVEGCLLMVNNIWNRWQVMKDIQNNGQQSLLEENCNNEIVDMNVITKKVIAAFQQVESFTRLNQILADFFMKNGPLCKDSEIKKILRRLEEEDKIEVKRTPPYTNKGRLSKFFADEKKQKTEIRWKR